VFVNTTFIFHLGQNLEVFKIKESQKTTVAAIEREGRSLELAERFEILWQNLWENQGLDFTDQIYLLIGSRAGFTDGRIIFIWLENWQQFYPEKKFLVYKLSPEEAEIGLGEESSFNQILEKAEVEGTTKLVYSQEPRIGGK